MTKDFDTRGAETVTSEDRATAASGSAVVNSHTSGPWQVCGDAAMVATCGDPWNAVQTPDGAFDVISCGNLRDAHYANVRLVAAAPAMLDALKALRKDSHECYCSMLGKTCAPCLADAAIAQAEAL